MSLKGRGLDRHSGFECGSRAWFDPSLLVQFVESKLELRVGRDPFSLVRSWAWRDWAWICFSWAWALKTNLRAVVFHFRPNRVFSWVRSELNEMALLYFFHACSRVHGAASFLYETTSFYIGLNVPPEEEGETVSFVGSEMMLLLCEEMHPLGDTKTALFQRVWLCAPGTDACTASFLDYVLRDFFPILLIKTVLFWSTVFSSSEKLPKLWFFA